VLTVGTAGVGTDDHLLILALQEATGAEFSHVPCNGTPPIVTGLLSCSIEVGSFNNSGLAAAAARLVGEDFVRRPIGGSLGARPPPPPAPLTPPPEVRTGSARVVVACTMDRHADRPPSAFTAPERELIRREMGMRFGQYPRLADGLFLRTWRSGPQAGQPKLPPAIRSMLTRGLVELRSERGRMPRAVFTAAGLAALRQLLRDRRAMDARAPSAAGPPAPGSGAGSASGRGG
jgi:hypothetical protein